MSSSCAFPLSDRSLVVLIRLQFVRRILTVRFLFRFLLFTHPPSPSLSLIARSGDVAFAENEIERRTAADAFDVWEPLAHAIATPARAAALAVVDDNAGVTLTYADVERRARRVGLFLRHPDVGGLVAAGERVGVLLPNCYAAIEVHYAIAGAARAIALNLNYRLAAPELAHIFSDAKPCWIVASTDFRAKLLVAVARWRESDVTTLRGILWLDSNAVDASATPPSPSRAHQRRSAGDAVAAAQAGSDRGYAEFDYARIAATGCVSRSVRARAAGAPPPRAFEIAVAAGEAAADFPSLSSADAGCEMYYTSGTTGLPKGAFECTFLCAHRARTVECCFVLHFPFQSLPPILPSFALSHTHPRDIVVTTRA